MDDPRLALWAIIIIFSPCDNTNNYTFVTWPSWLMRGEGHVTPSFLASRDCRVSRLESWVIRCYMTLFCRRLSMVLTSASTSIQTKSMYVLSVELTRCTRTSATCGESCFYHCLHVCLSVCLCVSWTTQTVIGLWADFHEIWRIVRLWTRDELIRFSDPTLNYGYRGCRKSTSRSTLHSDSRCCRISNEAATFTFVF